jgi:hypothetical protein
MKRWLLLISGMLASQTLYGGVDHGNPSRTIYNLVDNYRIGIRPEWTETQHAGGVIRLDVHLTHRDEGFFVVTAKDPEIPEGMQICGKQAAGSSGASADWIGKDCAHAYFAGQFESLKSSVEAVIFPN